jgi:hypothetical protein
MWLSLVVSQSSNSLASLASLPGLKNKLRDLFCVCGSGSSGCMAPIGIGGGERSSLVELLRPCSLLRASRRSFPARALRPRPGGVPSPRGPAAPAPRHSDCWFLKSSPGLPFHSKLFSSIGPLQSALTNTVKGGLAVHHDLASLSF